MIARFPDPYPDELLYSVLARCRRRLDEAEMGAFQYHLFRNEHARAKIDLPDRLETLSRCIPGRLMGQPEVLVDETTLLPYYAPFLHDYRYMAIREAMLRPHGQATTRRIASLNTLKLGRTDSLRCCTKCWREDDRNEERHRERYWRRSHQAPGCHVCPIHGLPLLRSPVAWSFRPCWQVYVDAGSVDLKKCAREAMPSGSSPILQGLAGDVQWLLHRRPDGIHANHLTRAYWLALGERGLIRGNRIFGSIVREMIIEEIGKPVLRLLKCDLSPHKDFDWLSTMLWPSKAARASQSPLRHLLLIRTLGHSAESFFGAMAAQAKEEPLAGMPSVLVKKTQILRQEIKTMWSDLTISRNEMARRLNVTAQKIDAEAARLGLPIPRGGVWGTRMRGAGSTATNDQIVGERRQRFLTLRKQYPAAGVKNLFEIEPTVVRWLQRHDRAWLAENRPARVKAGGAPRLDWQMRDQACAGRIPSILSKMLAAKKPVSISAVERQLRMRLRLTEDEMPKTSHLLKAYRKPRSYRHSHLAT